MSTSIIRIGQSNLALGDFHQAHDDFQNSLALERQTGSQIGTAFALNSLAELALLQSRLVDARELIETSLTILQDADEIWGLGRAYINLGRIALQEGDKTEALKLTNQGIEIARSIGETLFIYAGEMNLGMIAKARELPAQAHAHYLKALAIAFERNAPPMMLDTLVEIAALQIASEPSRKSFELLKFIQHHPAATFVARQRARQFAVSKSSDTAADGSLDLQTIVQGFLDNKPDD